jgi:GH15 family glucan-1,4-alpha-glucosidase
MGFQPIENYGVIGNMRSIALVGMGGSIDFLCYPDFDSPTVFAALLDDERGGYFQIQPQLPNTLVRQLYLPNTNILLTRFLADEGVAELTDYMPIAADAKQPNEIIRTVSVIGGKIDFQMRCQPRFHYATCAHTLKIEDSSAVFCPASDRCRPMALYSTVAMKQEAHDAMARFSLRAGETASFVFGGVRPQGQQPEMEFIMCWVAFDRGLRLAQKRSLSAPVDAWLRTRDEIRTDIFTNFWDADLQSFVQSKGTKDLDASVLLMPLMRFISSVDPMWLSTMRAHLVEDTLVRRYEAERTHVDGLPGGEGCFTACSFWYVECLSRAGELEKAQLLFERLLGYVNHVGLYSEELGLNGRHLGNFPQAFTHLALISAATYLDRVLSGTDDAVWR